MVELSLTIVYLPGLRNSLADKLSRQPSEVGQPDGGSIGDSGNMPRSLQDPVVFFFCCKGVVASGGTPIHSHRLYRSNEDSFVF